jgi:hypothetical protein
MRGLLLDSVILFHAAWVLFLAVGFVLALRYSKVAVIHGGGLLCSFFLNLMGWYCPLTYLENMLHALEKGGDVYSSSFMKEYVYRFLYPDLPELTIRICEMIFVFLNVLSYVYLAKRRGWFQGPVSRT